MCNNKEVLRAIWQVLDANGNGSASLAEIDRMVHMLSKGRKYGGFFQSVISQTAGRLRARRRLPHLGATGPPPELHLAAGHRAPRVQFEGCEAPGRRRVAGAPHAPLEFRHAPRRVSPSGRPTARRAPALARPRPPRPSPWRTGLSTR